MKATTMPNTAIFGALEDRLVGVETDAPNKLEIQLPPAINNPIAGKLKID